MMAKTWIFLAVLLAFQTAGAYLTLLPDYDYTVTLNFPDPESNVSASSADLDHSTRVRVGLKSVLR